MSRATLFAAGPDGDLQPVEAANGEADERPSNIDKDSEHFWLFEELP